jgi:hypothetical protein
MKVAPAWRRRGAGVAPAAHPDTISAGNSE